MTITSNGSEAPPAVEWYDTFVTADKLGLTGAQLRQLRDEGGLPEGAWRRITRGKRRMHEYNPAVIDKLAVATSGESNVAEPDHQPSTVEMRERMKSEGHLIPLAEISLEPRALEVLAVVGRLGPIVDESGRVRTVLQDLMPNGASYSNSSVTQGAWALEQFGLIKREMRGKRTFSMSITSRGRKWLAGNRDEVPYVPDTRHGQVATANGDDPLALFAGQKPVAEVDAPTEPPEPAPAPQPEPVPEVPFPEPEVEAEVEAAPLPQQVGLERHTLLQYAATNGPAVMAEAVDPGAIAAALLRQTVRVLADTDLAAVVAERDALRAHVATLQAHVTSLTTRAHDAEAALRETQGVLHNIESQLTPMLTGQTEGLDWLDARTRTDLLVLIGKAAEWAR